MKFTFLTKSDILSAIKTDQLAQIIGNDDTLIEEQEKAMVSYMKSYLNNRFDMADTFPTISEWDSTTDFVVATELTATIRGEEVNYIPAYFRNEHGYIRNYCYHNQRFYICIVNNTDIEPGVADDWEDFWSEKDPRIGIIKNYCIDLTVFTLFKRVAPRKIPQIRIDLYNLAKEWLENTNKGKINPELPLPLLPDESTDELQWGSNESREYRW